MKLVGVVMAGGRNTRFGSVKALAEVNRKRIVDRVIEALSAVCPDVVMIANEIDSYRTVALPMRGDVVEAAALGGLLTALRWSEELGADGIVVSACDLPFASGTLLQAIVDTAAASAADCVLPESGSRRGLEPLFGFYSNRCTSAVEHAIERGDFRLVSFHDAVNVVRYPIERVRQIGDPQVLFMNVNTWSELENAERIAASQ